MQQIIETDGETSVGCDSGLIDAVLVCEIRERKPGHPFAILAEHGHHQAGEVSNPSNVAGLGVVLLNVAADTGG